MNKAFSNNIKYYKCYVEVYKYIMKYSNTYFHICKCIIKKYNNTHLTIKGEK